MEATMDQKRTAFERWRETRTPNQLGWNGVRYTNARTQAQWVAFQMGWTMCENQKKG